MFVVMSTMYPRVQLRLCDMDLPSRSLIVEVEVKPDEIFHTLDRTYCLKQIYSSIII